MPAITVRCEDSFETDDDKEYEHSTQRIWIDGIQVVDIDMRVRGNIGDSHQRQWYSDGRPFVDITLKGDEHKGRMETVGSFWNKSGERIVINETSQD